MAGLLLIIAISQSEWLEKFFIRLPFGQHCLTPWPRPPAGGFNGKSFRIDKQKKWGVIEPVKDADWISRTLDFNKCYQCK